MRFKRLKLSGFKSFVEPAELRIEPGLTGIVGPNGCGKSNLLEAIRWVMGESSAKSMRGGGMEDVIFAGTATRPARNFAEVALLTEVSQPVLAAVSVEDGELEVVRRIERGAGSAYRANGRDVRAKDVALLFADAATGAHSPALVSQGRIAAVISARPAERRQMLEEAAGIAGLHVRRKDAEQKLRATEANLERLQQVLGDMEARALTLAKQARAAERYRALSREIAVAEARALFARWRSAAEAAKQARDEAAAAEAQVHAAHQAQTDAQASQRTAIETLATVRTTLQTARETSQSLGHQLTTLTAERDAATQRLADLDRQQTRISEDSAREDRLTHDATAALERLEAENARVQSDVAGEEARGPALAQAQDGAERAVREAEVALAEARAELARADADIKVADAALVTAQTRERRATEELDRTRAQLANLGDATALAGLRDEALADCARATADREAAARALAEAQSGRDALVSARDIAQSDLATLRAETNAMVREIDALARDLAKRSGSGDRALDQVEADKGFEKALAAALGDDLAAVIGDATGDGHFWTGCIDVPGHGTLPEGCVWLSDHVRAPGALHARLALIMVCDTDTGQPLDAGMRLVTRDGRMRRWDGFVSSGDGAGAAERLERRTRLTELEAARPALEASVQSAEAMLSESQQRLADLQTRIASGTAALNAAEVAERQALRDRDQAEHALTRDAERRDDLAERIERLSQDAAAALTEHAAAQAARAALPDGAAQREQVTLLAERTQAAQTALRSAHAALAAQGQALAALRERRATVRAEIRGWQGRSGEAAQRLRDMQMRAAELAAEREAIVGKPEALGGQIAALEQAANAARTNQAQAEIDAGDAEKALVEAERIAAATAETLALAREQRAGATARAEHQDQRRIELAQGCGERFQCPPPVLPERFGFDPADIDSAETEASEHDRLAQARERLGAVNLIAADELATLETDMATIRAEHDELVEAIARLRGSIGALNREGRQRLLAAFAAVDGHFRELFARLFNGGKAHLELIDSDDPLEAGLEIMAQPPGKRLSSLTLLSGGEQALTAVALIFGLFLTNPAPICVLDEVDAPLDDANIDRFCDLLDHMARLTDTRYLIVTHNAVTMSRMHRLFGVTMIEQGVSRLVSVDLGGAVDLLAAE
ncbi:AAA family ATPase [Blastomonas sp.]|uniref:chromosome segregation SMC family protein n=1 Tax=Blastomonas sp. TaxID=1909299 RepID=UPI00261547A9|nr:AAA family ATPase [Blastomonas sp.]MDM7955118.1 AAA family ATPase [Blastomonas sp.]